MSETSSDKIDFDALRESASFPRSVIAEIQRAAKEGIYSIRGSGAKRKVPNFDDFFRHMH